MVLSALPFRGNILVVQILLVFFTFSNHRSHTPKVGKDTYSKLRQTDTNRSPINGSDSFASYGLPERIDWTDMHPVMGPDDLEKLYSLLNLSDVE